MERGEDILLDTTGLTAGVEKTFLRESDFQMFFL
jgi:hypothetical protein